MEMQIIIRECLFNGSISEINGGAIYIYFSRKILIEKCVFQNGRSILGGSIYYEEDQGIYSNIILFFKLTTMSRKRKPHLKFKLFSK